MKIVVNAVKQIRAKHTEPILLIEHLGYANDATNARHREMTSASNKASRRAYDALVAEGVADLYYLSKEELGCTAEMMVDYVHLTDYGMKHQVIVVERKVREILNMPVGQRITQQPVTQNEQGVALVSGCSPRIFSMLQSGMLSPMGYMLDILGTERYAKIAA